MFNITAKETRPNRVLDSSYGILSHLISNKGPPLQQRTNNCGLMVIGYTCFVTYNTIRKVLGRLSNGTLLNGIAKVLVYK